MEVLKGLQEVNLGGMLIIGEEKEPESVTLEIPNVLTNRFKIFSAANIKRK